MSYIHAETPVQAIRRLTELIKDVDELFTKLALDVQTSFLGGTHPIVNKGWILNVASLYMPDGAAHRQAKIHITPNERKAWAVEAGSALRVFDTPKARVGILICYGVELPEAARYLTDHGRRS